MSRDPADAPVVLYRWPDGSHVQVEFHGSWDDAAQANVVTRLFTLQCANGAAATFRLLPAATGFYLVGPSPLLPPAAEPHLRGFLLEDGVPNGEVFLANSAILRTPIFVPDDLWDRRHEIAARDHVEGAGGLVSREPFLGVVRSLVLRRVLLSPDLRHKDLWIARVGRNLMVANYLPFDQLVDEVLAKHLAFQESDRDRTRQELAPRGEWVRPTPEEVELFLLLGERLPFLWDAENARDWSRAER